MNNHTVRLEVGPELVLLGSQFEKGYAGGRVELQLAEDGAEKAVGEVKGELVKGVVALEEEEAGYAVV